MKKLTNEKLLKAIEVQEGCLENVLELKKSYPTWSESKKQEDNIRDILNQLYAEKRVRGI